MKSFYATNLTPNAYIVIEFTADGGVGRGQFSKEADARKTFESLKYGMISAQLQVDTNLGAAGGQDTVWTERNF